MTQPLRPGWFLRPASTEPATPLPANGTTERPFRSGTFEEQAMKRRQSPRRGRTHRSIAQKLDRVLGKVDDDE